MGLAAPIQLISQVTNENLQRQLSSLWRIAQQHGWIRRCRLQVGWRIEDGARRRSLAKRVLSASGWNASPDEEYDPEDDPAEFIAHIVIEFPSRALLEHQLRWANQLAAEFGATLPRLVLGAA
jgi:hypothetical protein